MPAIAVHRSYILFGAALALPIVVLVVLQLVFAFSREREEVERSTLTRAEQVVQLADAQVNADLALMRVLATAGAVERRDWPEAYARAREIAAFNPHWRNVIVSDLETRQEVFSLRRPYGAPAPLNAGLSGGEARVVREGPGCPCVYLHTPVGVDERYRLSVALDPQLFQAMLLRYIPDGSVGAIVDGDGHFIARSEDFEDRVGTPATRFVRDAVAGDEPSGFYVGTTYEGFENHTAFATSRMTGWSAHIAIASALIEAPQTYSYISIIVGALLALGLAAALIAWALRDLAERRESEARLAQTQKLEAIGQLTGGVAHDFNNLLTVVIGGLNMLLKRITDEKQREIAEHMLDAAKRGDKLTKQLLAFSRGKRTELAVVDLHALVPGMEELLRRSVPAEISLDYALDPRARWVLTDANQLELAVLNLVINARDAMPEGGRIVIAARPSRKEERVELVVSDTGMGMPKDVADRAMEPFFTTKPADKGTGLGLAQVFGAARQSGGHVEIDSAPGRGTVVRLVLPEADEPPPAPAAEQSEEIAATPQSTGQRVLVVDDEIGVLKFIAGTLRDAGYETVEALDPGAALRLLDADRPDLLLTDYSMPGMNGLELAEHARAKAGGLRVLIVSGYADADALEASAAQPTLLRKPFDERALLDAVRDVLAA